MYSFAYKNYYERLGVGRYAPTGEIRRAFRQLARIYHPDVAQDKAAAEEIFILLNEAHQTLTDTEKRKIYDQELAQGRKFSSGENTSTKARERRPTPSPFGRRSTSPPFAKKPKKDAKPKQAPKKFRNIQWKTAKKGRPHTRKRTDLDTRALIEVPLEDAIRGAVHTVTVDSDEGMQHKRHKLKTYQVRIPKGVWQGQQLRLSGCGLQDLLTGEIGDLYLTINYAKHERFRLMSNDLFVEVDAAPWDTVLGAFMHILTLDGETSLKIPEGAQPGQRFTLEGYGMPASDGTRGNLIIALRVSLPKVLNEQQRELWGALAEAYRKQETSNPKYTNPSESVNSAS